MVMATHLSARRLWPCMSLWMLFTVVLVLVVGCGVDGSVLTYRAGLDGGTDASVIPDAGYDAGWPPCEWELEEVEQIRLDAPTSLVLDTGAEPHVAYYVVDGPRATWGWLRYARRVAGQWQITDVDGGSGQYGWVGLDPSLVLDGQDRPRIAYRDASQDVLMLASWDGAAWQLRVVETRGSSPGLVLDLGDLEQVGYARYDPITTRSELKLASWDGFAWQLQVLVDDGDVQHVSAATDSAGRVHLAYYDALPTRRHLRYAHWDGFTWVTQEVDADSSGDPGAGCRIALDGLDRPHISYLDVTGQRLKHATLAGAVWQVTVIEDAVRPGTTTGLVIDSEDLPIVAYDQHQTAPLTVARYEDNAWRTSPVDDDLWWSKYVDLATDSAGGFHLSFAGTFGAGEALHYARCAAP